MKQEVTVLLQALIGFIGGVIIALIGAIVGYVFQRRAEKRRRIKETQFQVYMKLMDIYNHYFWVTSMEFRGEKVILEHKRSIRNSAWQIADLLRFEDSVLYTENISRVLMSDEYPTVKARYEEMDEVLNKFGSLVNPRYQRVVKSISKDNLMRFSYKKQSFLKSTTPASMGLF